MEDRELGRVQKQGAGQELYSPHRDIFRSWIWIQQEGAGWLGHQDFIERMRKLMTHIMHVRQTNILVMIGRVKQGAVCISMRCSEFKGLLCKANQKAGSCVLCVDPCITANLLPLARLQPEHPFHAVQVRS